MVKEITPRFRDWQVRTAVNLFREEPDENILDVVEWKPDGYCYSLCFLSWDSKEEVFEIEPVGNRLLEVDDPVAFNKWLLNFIEYETNRRRMESDD